MADPIIARLRDRLEVNAPYAGVVADAYDAWIPVDELLPEEDAYSNLLEGIDGTVLELGCGTGRPLLRWLAAGRDIEGIDASADMLAILCRHAAERGLDPIVHHGDIAPLALGRGYAAIVCPAGTFSLVHDDGRARDALASYRDHLHPGGLLALTCFVPTSDFGETMTWRVRRTGTTSDGTTIVVHEAIRCDTDARLQVALNRMETYGPDGRLRDTWLRRMHLRWWPREEIEAVLADLGLVDIRSVGDRDQWVTAARRAH